MDDALLVRFLQGFGDLLRDRERLVHGNRAALQALGQVFALDQLHGQEVGGRAIGERRGLEAVDVSDAGVVQGSEDLRLALEAGQAVGVGGEGLGQELESHVAAELRVGGAVNLPHAACAQGGGDAVVRERLSDQQASWPSRCSGRYPPRTAGARPPHRFGELLEHHHVPVARASSSVERPERADLAPSGVGYVDRVGPP